VGRQSGLRIGNTAKADCTRSYGLAARHFVHVQLYGPAGIPGPAQRDHARIRSDAAASRFRQRGLYRHGGDFRCAQRLVHGAVRPQGSAGRRPGCVLAVHLHYAARNGFRHPRDLPHADRGRRGASSRSGFCVPGRLFRRTPRNLHGRDPGLLRPRCAAGPSRRRTIVCLVGGMAGSVLCVWRGRDRHGADHHGNHSAAIQRRDRASAPRRQV
jgi:hypothetical protein